MLAPAAKVALGTLGDDPPRPGDDVKLSIDLDVQKVAESGLFQGIERARSRVFPATGTSIMTALTNPVTGAALGPDTDAMTIRSSIGAGLIWDSPFGPIRIDYAFPLTKDPNDRVQQLRFSGGTKF